MCKKSFWTFIKFYCFVWCSTKKNFDCGELSNNEYLYKNTYAGHEGISLVLLGVSMGILNFLYDEQYLLSFALSMFMVFIYSLLVVCYVWFYKLNDVFSV